jgi:hypothetical protein
MTQHNSQTLAQYSTPWFTTAGPSITQHESQPLAQHTTPSLTTTGSA